MLSRLKKARLGKALYRISRNHAVGLPLRLLARLVQTEAAHPSHFRPANWRHNTRQDRILARYAKAEQAQP